MEKVVFALSQREMWLGAVVEVSPRAVVAFTTMSFLIKRHL